MIDWRGSSGLIAFPGIVFALGMTPIGSARAQPDPKPALSFKSDADRVVLTQTGEPIAEFVFNDRQILRPYLANIRLRSGRQVTRRLPPVAGKDAVDHADMHPGVWLAFGDINGHDFWRNKARIEHIDFMQRPTAADGRLSFKTRSRLRGRQNEILGHVEHHLTAAGRPQGWRLIWEATFVADAGDLVFGDQEEMGFGVRVATEITEKNGGAIVSSEALRTAKASWGQPARWCDDSGMIDGTPSGVTVMTAPSNFRGSWWHTRDYGLLVANAFGRAAMKQGEPSKVTVKQGESLTLTYAATFHEGAGYDPASEYASFVNDLGAASK